MNEIILTSSSLILIIAALRRVFRGKITPSLQYALWLLVALRLLIPGTLFSAPVSIVGLAEDVRSAVSGIADESLTPEPEFTAPIYIPDKIITIKPDSTPMPDIPVDDPPPTPHEPVPSSEQRFSVDWLDVIWKVGITTVSAAFLSCNLLYYRKLRSTRRRIPVEQLPVACPIPVYYVKDLRSPCLFGSAIYVNRKALHNDRLHHIIIHELTHRRHGDPLWTLLRCACLAIHWYNPLVWWAAHLSRRDCELSCDSAVLRTLGDGSGLSYGETLMAMLTTSSSSLLHAATTMSASKRTMAERLKLIVRRPKMMRLTAAALALITVCAVILSFGGCTEETISPTPDNEIGSNTDHSQTGNENPIDSDEILSPPENGFGFIPTSNAIYTHPTNLFTMELPPKWQQGLVLEESEDGISIYDSALYADGSEDGWIISVYPQPADFNYTQNPFFTLAEFDPNGTAQVYILEYSRAYNEPYSFLIRMISDTFTLSASEHQFSVLIHDSCEDNMSLAISYLPYLNWSNYKKLYGEDGLMQLLSALLHFVSTELIDWNQYHDILSTSDEGLDGEYREKLASIFATLYEKNQKQFLHVVSSLYITDAERCRIAAYVPFDLDSATSENDRQESTANDAQLIMSAGRSYLYRVQTVGTPNNLSLKLRDDWTLNSIRNAIRNEVKEYTCNTVLENDLADVVVSYSFRFPDEMKDGTILRVRYRIRYTDTEPYELPSGDVFYPEATTEELVAEIRLAGEGITAPVDEQFAKGQLIYDQIAEIAEPSPVIEVSRSGSLDFYDIICRNARINLNEAGLSDICYLSGFSSGGYSYPIWCDVGYEQTITYSISFLYTDCDISETFTFTYTVTVITTE